MPRSWPLPLPPSGGGGGIIYAQQHTINGAERLSGPNPYGNDILLLGVWDVRDGATFDSPTKIELGQNGNLMIGTSVFEGDIFGPGSLYGCNRSAGIHFTGKVNVGAIVGQINAITFLENEFSATYTIDLQVACHLIIAANASSTLPTGNVSIMSGSTLHLSNSVISSGVLLGATGGQITSDSFLTGFGLVSKNAELAIAGTVSPTSDIPMDNNIGVLSFKNTGGTAVSFATGAKYVVNLDGTSKKADLLSSTGGNIVISAGALLQIDTIANEGDVQADDEFIIAEIAAGEIGSIVGAFDLTSTTINGISFDVVKLDANGKVVSDPANNPGKKIALRGPLAPRLLTTPVVPEPSTYAMFGGLGVFAFAFWRRKRKK